MCTWQRSWAWEPTNKVTQHAPQLLAMAPARIAIVSMQACAGVAPTALVVQGFRRALPASRGLGSTAGSGDAPTSSPALRFGVRSWWYRELGLHVESLAHPVGLRFERATHPPPLSLTHHPCDGAQPRWLAAEVSGHCRLSVCGRAWAGGRGRAERGRAGLLCVEGVCMGGESENVILLVGHLRNAASSVAEHRQSCMRAGEVAITRGCANRGE